VAKVIQLADLSLGPGAARFQGKDHGAHLSFALPPD
jgi:hypothetical protein